MDDDDVNIDLDKLAENANLGRKWRTYRQRRRNGAPGICGMLSASLIVTMAMINGSIPDMLPWLVIGVPVGAALGFGYNYVADIPGDYGRIWITVYDNGLLIESESERPVATTEFSVVKSNSPIANDNIQYLSLVWTDADGIQVSCPLKGFGAANSLRKALEHQQFSTPPIKERVGVATAIAVLVVAGIVWSLQPTSVSQLEDRDDVTAFCEDSSMVVSDANPYSGSGPHNLVEVHQYESGGFSITRGFTDAAQDRGWSAAPSDVTLVACGEANVRNRAILECSDYVEMGGSGEYHSFEVRAADITYDIYEAATRDHVATVTVEGGDTSDFRCPDQTYNTTGEFRIPPTAEAVVDAFEEFVDN